MLAFPVFRCAFAALAVPVFRCAFAALAVPVFRGALAALAVPFLGYAFAASVSALALLPWGCAALAFFPAFTLLAGHIVTLALLTRRVIALTLLAGVLGSALPEAAVIEMSAVGGVILLGMALNMLGCTRERIKVANMLPAIFLPILWMAAASLLK